jgi:hypothetical protein
MGSRVVVFGGTGFFGRYLVEDLLAHTDATITVASRHTRDWIEYERRVVFAPCDVYAYETVRSLVDRHDLVIHCAGPFQYLPLHPLSAAIELRRNYIDLSEGREFYRRVGALERQIDLAGITALTGISIVPALQMLLVEIVRPLLDTLTIIRTHLAPGTYRNRGPAMFHTMLMGVGTPFPVWRERQLEVSQHLGAERYERTAERRGQRNGTRERPWDTRVGTIELTVPRVRKRSTSASRSPHSRDTWLLLIPVIPSACTMLSGSPEARPPARGSPPAE